MNIVDYLKGEFWEHYADDCYTPDAPQLRYEGPIPVFMYGFYATYQEVAKIVGDNAVAQYEDLKGITRVTTKAPLTYLNNHDEKIIKYRSLLMPPGASIEGYNLTKRKIRGMLFTVSLRGIKNLDRYFYNEHKFYRSVVAIEKSANNPFMSAYTYLVNPKTIGETREDGTTVLKPGLNLRFPVVASEIGGDMVYI